MSHRLKYDKVRQHTLGLHLTYIAHVIRFPYIRFSTSQIESSGTYEKCKAMYIKLTSDIHSMYVYHITTYAKYISDTFPRAESFEHVQNRFRTTC